MEKVAKARPTKSREDAGRSEFGEDMPLPENTLSPGSEEEVRTPERESEPKCRSRAAAHLATAVPGRAERGSCVTMR